MPHTHLLALFSDIKVTQNSTRRGSFQADSLGSLQRIQPPIGETAYLDMTIFDLNQNLIRTLTAMIITLALSACGGGSEGGDAAGFGGNTQSSSEVNGSQQESTSEADSSEPAPPSQNEEQAQSELEENVAEEEPSAVVIDAGSNDDSDVGADTATGDSPSSDAAGSDTPAPVPPATDDSSDSEVDQTPNEEPAEQPPVEEVAEEPVEEVIEEPVEEVAEEPAEEVAEEPVEEPVSNPKASVSWAVPDSRQNGDTLYPYELSGYRLQYRVAGSGESYTTVEIESALTTETELNLTVGSYEFRIAAIDSDGVSSGYSSIVRLDIP